MTVKENMNEEREKLIKEIDDLIVDTKHTHGDCYYANAIADYILEDRNRICAPLVELPKRSVDYGDSMFIYASSQAKAICATLKLAGLKDGK